MNERLLPEAANGCAVHFQTATPAYPILSGYFPGKSMSCHTRVQALAFKWPHIGPISCFRKGLTNHRFSCYHLNNTCKRLQNGAHAMARKPLVAPQEITIFDVAREANVSYSTVSRV